MFGKASLLLVLGFSTLFLVMGVNFGRLTTRAVDNETDYYRQSTAHDIAVSAANIAANQIFMDPTWTAGYSNVDFNGGKINVNIQVLDAFKNIRRINASGSYDGVNANVQVTLQPSKFSKFAYYSVVEPSGIWWTNGDTVWGPFHTQDYLRVAGHPVFNGKVTTNKSILKYSKYGKSDYPILNGGYEQGVDLPLPTNGISDLETISNSDGHTFSSHDTVYLTFATDSVRYKYSYKGPETTALLSSFAPNGVIFADNATLRVKGTVQGQYTIGVSGTSTKWSTKGGDIYIDDNIQYKTDPNKNPNSTDLLGIVAENNVWITDNYANNHDVTIDGAIYAQNGGFGAEHYSTRPNSGTIYLNGGITQHQRQAVGTFSSYGIASGFNKNYRYDKRLMFSSPPSFPNTGSFEIVSWYE